MKKEIHAIYENGILRPLEPLEGIPEKSEVEFTIQSPSSYPDLKDLFGTLPKEDADEMKKIIEEEFEKVDLNDRSLRL